MLGNNLFFVKFMFCLFFLLFEESFYLVYKYYFLPARVAQLVKANFGKCDPNKWHMVLGSNPAIDDTFNLSSVGCCGTVNTLRFGSPWKVLRASP